MGASAFPAFAAPLPLGVTLFGASWCPYCRKAAQLLVSLRDAGQIELMAFSLDGGPIGVIADPIPDAGQAAALGVRGVPVTVVFDPLNREPPRLIKGFRGYRPYLDELRAIALHFREGFDHG